MDQLINAKLAKLFAEFRKQAVEQLKEYRFHVLSCEETHQDNVNIHAFWVDGIYLPKSDNRYNSFQIEMAEGYMKDVQEIIHNPSWPSRYEGRRIFCIKLSVYKDANILLFEKCVIKPSTSFGLIKEEPTDDIQFYDITMSYDLAKLIQNFVDLRQRENFIQWLAIELRLCFLGLKGRMDI